MAEEILYENQGRVAIVTINRPESRNAINQGVREGLAAAWERFEKDTDARAAILESFPSIWISLHAECGLPNVGGTSATKNASRS